MPTPSPQSLAALVVAERRMMHHAYNALERLQAAGTNGGIEYNAFLESFLLHYRNILDFLSPRPRARSADVQATAFLPAGSSLSAPTKYRDPIDKRLSHITAYRTSVDPSNRAWNPAAMLVELEVSWNDFIAALGTHRPGQRTWFEALPQDGPSPIPIAIGGYTVVAATTSATHLTTVAFPDASASDPT